MPIDENELAARLGTLPADAATRLHRVMQDSAFDGVIGAADARYLAQQLGQTVPELALALVPFAQLHAVVPISGYQVGAVGVGLSGALYYGANLEVAGQALSFTVHAEQAATANAWLHGEQGLAALGISAAPCGYCRQFLYELATAATLTIMLPQREPAPLTGFLPDPFGPHDLGVQGGLMQAQDNGLALARPSSDPTALAALAAANASYAPYTGTFAGIALRAGDGAIFTGRHAENAAYNPSMSPLAAALSRLVFNTRTYADIAEAVLVELPGPASQIGATTAWLGSVTDVPLTVLNAIGTQRPGTDAPA